MPVSRICCSSLKTTHHWHSRRNQVLGPLPHCGTAIAHLHSNGIDHQHDIAESAILDTNVNTSKLFGRCAYYTCLLGFVPTFLSLFKHFIRNNCHNMSPLTRWHRPAFSASCCRTPPSACQCHSTTLKPRQPSIACMSTHNGLESHKTEEIVEVWTKRALLQLAPAMALLPAAARCACQSLDRCNIY